MLPLSSPSSRVGGSVISSKSSRASTTSSRKKSLVEDPYYRIVNLASNHIYVRSTLQELPEEIDKLVKQMGQDCGSLGPSLDQIKDDAKLYDLQTGSGKQDVKQYFYSRIFYDPKSDKSDLLQRSARRLMSKKVVPQADSTHEISTPVPDLLYGYDHDRVFTEKHNAYLFNHGFERIVNTVGLSFPFFAIKFKGDGPGSRESMWVATNQCIGASTSCVNIAKCFSDQLSQCKSDSIQPINSAAFSIAMNGSETRLYVSWKHDKKVYYMQQFETFSLQTPNHFSKFHKYVQNILDWGRDKRLKDIQQPLNDPLLVSPPPPLDESTSRNSRKRRASSPVGDES